MPWVICFLIGLLIGAASALALLWTRHQKLQEREKAVDATAAHARAAADAAAAKERELARNVEELTTARSAFDRRVIAYDDLQRENALLKRDLQNIDVTLHKVRLDTEILDERQRKLDDRAVELATRYLKETVRAVGRSLNPNNYAACKERLQDVIDRCREIGFEISPDQERAYIADLKAQYELVVRAAVEREEQARIKAQIREEERLKREADREAEQANRERVAIQAALDQALAAARDQHGEEVEQLRARLAEAEARAQRAKSMAEQTRAGNVYVISNVGAFGQGVFKIGMTRRLEPLDRIRELGDASVPFAFDVHMMVSCDDAPTLENALHRALHKSRINRVNPRKEFFRADLDSIVAIVREHRGEVQYVADAQALEYNQSLSMSEEDAEYVEAVYEAAEGDKDAVVED